MNDLISITKAADELGIKPKTLIRWEKRGKIPPLSRSVRNGYRVLTLEDIARIKEWMHGTFVPDRHVA